jgi:hypothetical protein
MTALQEARGNLVKSERQTRFWDRDRDGRKSSHTSIPGDRDREVFSLRARGWGAIPQRGIPC